jgi:ABC-type sugar transport system ATPase subunit
MVLVGPSGCGKSTTLRLVAGLEAPTAGRVWIAGRDVTTTPAQQRDVAMVFQSYALYPHKTVRQNLAFPLRMRRVAPAEIARRVDAAADALGLVPLLDRKPRERSGGQRQRVALGRAMVREPAAFLLDEPLSNLDAGLRVRTRAELARLHRRLGATMLYVTHDQEEAMTLGDRVAVMRHGVLEQAAPPMELYRQPATQFVAGFIGSPAMNFFPCRLERGADGTRLSGAGWRLVTGPGLARTPAELVLGVRPHDMELVAPEAADLTGRVGVVERLGHEALLHVDTANGAEEPLRVVGPGDVAVREGETVGLRFGRDRLHLFEPGSGRRLD